MGAGRGRQGQQAPQGAQQQAAPPPAAGKGNGGQAAPGGPALQGGADWERAMSSLTSPYSQPSGQQQQAFQSEAPRWAQRGAQRQGLNPGYMNAGWGQTQQPSAQDTILAAQFAQQGPQPGKRLRKFTRNRIDPRMKAQFQSLPLEEQRRYMRGMQKLMNNGGLVRRYQAGGPVETFYDPLQAQQGGARFGGASTFGSPASRAVGGQAMQYSANQPSQNRRSPIGRGRQARQRQAYQPAYDPASFNLPGGFDQRGYGGRTDAGNIQGNWGWDQQQRLGNIADKYQQKMDAGKYGWLRDSDRFLNKWLPRLQTADPNQGWGQFGQAPVAGNETPPADTTVPAAPTPPPFTPTLGGPFAYDRLPWDYGGHPFQYPERPERVEPAHITSPYSQPSTRKEWENSIYSGQNPLNLTNVGGLGNVQSDASLAPLKTWLMGDVTGWQKPESERPDSWEEFPYAPNYQSYADARPTPYQPTSPLWFQPNLGGPFAPPPQVTPPPGPTGFGHGGPSVAQTLNQANQFWDKWGTRPENVDQTNRLNELASYGIAGPQGFPSAEVATGPSPTGELFTPSIQQPDTTNLPWHTPLNLGNPSV